MKCYKVLNTPLARSEQAKPKVYEALAGQREWTWRTRSLNSL